MTAGYGTKATDFLNMPGSVCRNTDFFKIQKKGQALLLPTDV